MDKYGVIDLNHVDFDKITFSTPKIGKRKSRNCGIKYDGKKFLVRLPLPLNAPFGLSKFTDEESGNSQYSLELSLGDNYENDVHSKPVYEFFKKLDELIKKEAQKNSWDWLGQKDADETYINLKYKSFFRFSKNKNTGEILNYPPRVKFSIRQENENLITKGIYDAHTKQKCDLNINNYDEVIPKGSDVRAVFEVGSVWSTNIGFGGRIVLYQARIYKNVTLDEDVCGFDDDAILTNLKKRKLNDDNTESDHDDLPIENDIDMTENE